MTLVRRVLHVSVFLAMLFHRSSGSFVDAATLSCSGATTLDDLSRCIGAQMPQEASNGYFPPTTKEQAAWRSVVRSMLQGTCEPELPARLAGIMQLRTFHDSSNGRSYCVLMEVLDADASGDVDRGWGTFIVDPHARRELHHHAPHPLSDATTERQALAIFRDTESRGYLMAGAHRRANRGWNTCQRAYTAADMAHTTGNMFQATNEELMAFYANASWWVIQWHGMAADDCKAAHVYMTHGRDAAPSISDKIHDLKARLLERHPDWKVELAGSRACGLHGAHNVQGRFLNGVPASDVCRTAADDYSGRFLHIEQDPAFRSFADWVQPVTEVWQAAPPR
jgi:hypothetical protein